MIEYNLILNEILILTQGEWVADGRVRNATKEDFQRFSKAQLDVYWRATFGWAYWALKNQNKFWNLESMIR